MSPPGDLLGFLRGLTAEHGDVVRFNLGTKPYVLFNRPAQVRQLFVDHLGSLEKPRFVRDSNRGYWGEGLTTLEAEAWRSRRALLRPVFGAGLLPRYLHIVAECTEELAAVLMPGQLVCLRAELRGLTGRIAARFLFDAEVEGYGSPEANRRRAGVIRFQEAYGEDFKATMTDEPVAPLTLQRPRAPRNIDTTLAIIDDRLGSGEDRGDVLSLLMRATFADGTRLTRDELLGEVLQMFFAGHHTVPESLTSFWRVLASEPEVAERVRQEALSAPPAGEPALETASATYRERVLKESLRYFPPAPILYRQVRTPFALEGHVLEPGTAVWVCPQLLHHDARNFPEPGLFLPERFERENLGSIPPYAYLPFGAGPRTCIASRLAMLQLGLIVAILARRFRFVPMGWGEGGELFGVTE